MRAAATASAVTTDLHRDPRRLIPALKVDARLARVRGHGTSERPLSFFRLVSQVASPDTAPGSVGHKPPVAGLHPVQHAAGDNPNHRGGDEKAEDYRQVRWESEQAPYECHQYDEPGEDTPGTDGPQYHEPGRVLFRLLVPSGVLLRRFKK
jgi:hypothetical protein